MQCWIPQRFDSSNWLTRGQACTLITTMTAETANTQCTTVACNAFSYAAKSGVLCTFRQCGPLSCAHKHGFQCSSAVGSGVLFQAIEACFLVDQHWTGRQCHCHFICRETDFCFWASGRRRTCIGMCSRKGSTATRRSMVAVTTMVLMKPTMLSQLSLLKDWMNSMGRMSSVIPPTAT